MEITSAIPTLKSSCHLYFLTSKTSSLHSHLWNLIPCHFLSSKMPTTVGNASYHEAAFINLYLVNLWFGCTGFFIRFCPFECKSFHQDLRHWLLTIPHQYPDEHNLLDRWFKVLIMILVWNILLSHSFPPEHSSGTRKSINLPIPLLQVRIHTAGTSSSLTAQPSSFIIWSNEGGFNFLQQKQRIELFTNPSFRLLQVASRLKGKPLFLSTQSINILTAYMRRSLIGRRKVFVLEFNHFSSFQASYIYFSPSHTDFVMSNVTFSKPR